MGNQLLKLSGYCFADSGRAGRLCRTALGCFLPDCNRFQDQAAFRVSPGDFLPLLGIQSGKNINGMGHQGAKNCPYAGHDFRRQFRVHCIGSDLGVGNYIAAQVPVVLGLGNDGIGAHSPLIKALAVIACPHRRQHGFQRKNIILIQDAGIEDNACFLEKGSAQQLQTGTGPVAFRFMQRPEHPGAGKGAGNRHFCMIKPPITVKLFPGFKTVIKENVAVKV